MKSKYSLTIALVISSYFFLGWGETGHSLIGNNSINYFNTNISSFKIWQSYLNQHSSDPDKRKPSDPTEGPKHYIDIDAIPEFNQYGYLVTKDLDSLKKKYNYTQTQIDDIGTLPWVINATYDSLKKYFRLNIVAKQQYYAADLSHYIGDGHMPLHLTQNHNGQLTNQSGIHKRYESTMVDAYKSSILFSSGSTEAIPNIRNYTFNFIYKNHKMKDTILAADLLAKAKNNNSTSGSVYNAELWRLTSRITIELMNNAAKALAQYIYTAYCEANNIVPIEKDSKSIPANFSIKPFPNPFNPSTSFVVNIPANGNLRLEIFDATGRIVETLINEHKEAGSFIFNWNPVNLGSGIYFVRCQLVGTNKIYNSTTKISYLK